MVEKNGHELNLTKNSVKGVIKDETNTRVTGDAVLQVMAIEEERIRSLSRAAKMIADNAGRKTIQEQDVRVAEQIMKGEQ